MDPNAALSILTALLESFSALFGIIVALIVFLAQRKMQLLPEEFNRTKLDLRIELMDEEGKLKIPESRIDRLQLGVRGAYDFDFMYTVILDDLAERFAPGEKVPKHELFPEALERLKELSERYKKPMLIVKEELSHFKLFLIPCIVLLVYCLLLLPSITITPLPHEQLMGFSIWVAIGLAILTVLMLVKSLLRVRG